MSPRTYLDWNATAPLRPEARAAMIAAFEVAGNPSSVHAEGRAARVLVERARAQVAAAVGAQPSEVVFTAGATEAASVLARLPAEWGVVVEPTAHDALWAHHRPHAGPGGKLAYAMGLANSETGLLAEPPARGPEGWALPAGDGNEGGHAQLLLLDITQAVGRVPFSFAWSGADLAVLSAHKLGGPKGVGALLVREGCEIAPLVLGGGQEMGRRAGTENVAGIAGFGAAAEAAQADLAAGCWAETEKIRNVLENTIAQRAKETISVGKGAPRLPNTLCLITPGWKGETQVMAMDLAGFAISAGSACSSGKVRASRVLGAMGFGPEAAGSAIRVSLGAGTGAGAAERFGEAWLRAEAQFRARRQK